MNNRYEKTSFSALYLSIEPYSVRIRQAVANRNSARVVASLAAALLCLSCAVSIPVYAEEKGQSTDPALTQSLEENEKIASAGTFAEISSGHVDMGPKMIDGSYALMVRDDTSTTPVWRHLEDTVFRVSDKALIDVPSDDEYAFIHGEKKVWVVPQQEIEGVVWLGWNTQDPALLKSLNGGVKLIYGGHQGEGNFYVFVQAGNFSGPQQLWNSEKNESQPVNVEPNTHTHANWVFTSPGVHLVRVTAQAQLSDGTVVEDTQILRFAVGDSADAKEASQTQWNLTTPPAEPAQVEEPHAIDTFANLPVIIGIAAVIVAGGVCVAVVFRRKKTASAQNQAMQNMGQECRGATAPSAISSCSSGDDRSK